MKLPSRLTIALASVITGADALALETATVTHPVKVAIALLGGALLYLLHPYESGTVAAPAVPDSARTPDGALEAPPPGI